MESEDDCEQTDDTNEHRIILKMQTVFAFDIPPWIDATEFPSKRDFYDVDCHDVGVQTNSTHALC